MVPGLETRGGGGGAVCAPLTQPACGGGMYAVPPPQLAPWGGRGGLLPCGQGSVGVLPTQSALVLEFLQNPFFQGGRCTYVRGAHPVHKPVRRELGLVLGRSQVIPNDQVGKDFVFLELRRHGREALALIQRGLDLAADRH